MFNIRKIYIQNFKGVYHKTVVELAKNSLTILNGPNGFGKTTIFDTIELCLRGHLERTENYNYVTKKNSDHAKPFYQNRINEDVVLKLWIEDGEDNHIIIKRLNKENDGRTNGSRAFRPDAWGLLETYYTNEISTFSDIPDFSKIKLVDQDFVDQLFFGNRQLSMTKLYPLFNYLQQEDNIYFLKKDEEDKKEELNFLFQTQNEAFQLEQITDFHKNIKAIRDSLSSRISEIGQASGSSEDTTFQKIFLDKNIKFDSIEPFDSIIAEDLNVVFEGYNSEIQKLIDMSRTFESDEYEKNKLRLGIKYALDNNRFLTAISLQRFFEESVFDALRLRIDRNNQLRTYGDKLIEYRSEGGMLESLGFEAEFISKFSDIIGRRNLLNTQIGEIGKIIRELNQARSAALSRFQDLNFRLAQESSCPLCDTEWPGMQELADAINEKTQSLNSYNKIQISELNDLDQTISLTYFQPISKVIETILTEPDNAIDPRFYIEVAERRGNLVPIQRFMSLLTSNKIDIESSILQSHVTIEKLADNISSLKTRLQDIYESVEVDETKIGDTQILGEYYNDNPTLILSVDLLQQKQRYVQSKFNSSKMFSVNVLNKRLDSIISLESRLLNIKTKLNAAIKDYKKKMIEKIKIPFYIYSGKILQHYQQGYGIFVDVNDKTSRVRFLTDESTDHDIIHQLSSGQLAVVSIAFCLSLNKVYASPRHFKFLAIDDPVQTLDDLNIHSFIELLRHEFDEYQLIISTHEENIANYLDYKFEKFQRDRVVINVQEIFYSNQQLK